MSRKQDLAQRVQVFRRYVGSVLWKLTEGYDYIYDITAVVEYVVTLMLVTWDNLRSNSGLSHLSESDLKRWCNTLGLVPVEKLFMSLGIMKDYLLWVIETHQPSIPYSRFKGAVKAQGGVVSFVMPVQPLLTAFLEGKGLESRDSEDLYLQRELLFSDVYQALSFAERFNPFACKVPTVGRKWPANPRLQEAIDRFVTVDMGLGSVTNYPPPVAQALGDIFERWLTDSYYIPEEWFGFSAGATEEVPRRRSHFLEKSKYLYLTMSDLDLVAVLTRLPKAYLVDRLELQVLCAQAGISTGEVLTSRYSVVPKSASKFRGISMEPTALTWLQQGVGRSLVRHLHKCALTRNHVNLYNAYLNAELACEGSEFLTQPADRDLITLDLSDASDSVCWKAVSRALQDTGCYFAEYVLGRCRTTAVTIPYRTNKGRTGFKRLQLNKFAGMGNRLTFPLEVCVFVAVCIAAIRGEGDDPNRSRFRVYGDDIVIERKYANSVISFLQQMGFKVNISKSFLGESKPRFRESCGGHYLNGINVTPIRLGRPWAVRPAYLYSSPVMFEELCALGNDAVYSELPDLRSVLLWTLLDSNNLPQRKRPCFTAEGSLGLISSFPTNWHLETKGPFTGPLVGVNPKHTSWKSFGSFAPFIEKKGVRSDYQNGRYFEHRCGVVTTSFDFSYVGLYCPGESPGHSKQILVRSAPGQQPGFTTGLSADSGTVTLSGGEGQEGFPQTVLREFLRRMELKRTSERIGNAREAKGFAQSSSTASLVEIDDETVTLALGHTPRTQLKSAVVCLPAW